MNIPIKNGIVRAVNHYHFYIHLEGVLRDET